MEKTVPFLYKKNYAGKNKIKSINLYMKFLDIPSLKHEVLAYKFDFHNNGFLKTETAYGPKEKPAYIIEYNDYGQKLKKIENKNNRATHPRPEIETTIYEYSNDLIIEEKMYGRSTNPEMSEMQRAMLSSRSNSKYIEFDELYEKTIYIYNDFNKLIEKKEVSDPNDTNTKSTFEYFDDGITKEFDPFLNYIYIYKYDLKGLLIEEKKIYAPEYKNYKVDPCINKDLYVYDNDDLLIERQSYNRRDELISSMKYIYEKSLLSRIDFYENNKLVQIWRFDNKMNTFFGSLF
jgi:hypothetical protein